MSAAERERLAIALLPRVRIIASLVARRCGRRCEYDELVSVGSVALLCALDRYQPGRGANVKTFVSHRVHGAMRDLVRSQARVPVHVSLSDSASDAEDDVRTLMDVLPDPRWKEREERERAVERVREALRKLPHGKRNRRERAVIAWMLAGGSASDLAARWGVHVTRVSQIRKQAFARLRTLLA